MGVNNNNLEIDRCHLVTLLWMYEVLKLYPAAATGILILFASLMLGRLFSRSWDPKGKVSLNLILSDAC